MHTLTAETTQGVAGNVDARVRYALDGMTRDKERLTTIDRYVRGLHAAPYLPEQSSDEYRALIKRSFKNMIPLILDAASGALSVDGYVRGDGSVSPPEWTLWRTTGLESRQTQVHRESLASGHSYVTVLPDPVGPSRPIVRAYRAVRSWVAYADPAADEWPLYAVFVSPAKRSDSSKTQGTYIDGSVVVEFTTGDNGVTVNRSRRHGMGMCPVQRFSPVVDLDGRCFGVVEPLIPLQDRINQTSLNQLIAQHFTAHTVRWATGLTPSVQVDADGNPIMDEETGLPVPAPITMDPGAVWTLSNPDARVGQLPGTSTSDFLESIEADMRHMTAISQTPPQYLIANLVNLSAEALAASEQAFARHISEMQSTFGHSWSRVLRLCAKVSGDSTGAKDERSQVTWADRGNRSLAQASDAISKLVSCGIPVEALLSKIPGLTQTDIENIKQAIKDNDDVSSMADKFSHAMLNQDGERDEQDRTPDSPDS